jgi:hypothetical protein
LAREFDDIERLIAALQEESAREATLTAKVATTTSPGGEQIAFRGRIVVEARIGEADTAVYVEQVMPYVATTKSTQLGPSEESATDLRSAQLALARQLRSYRGEYQAVVDAAREQLIAKLAEAGVQVVEPNG